MKCEFNVSSLEIETPEPNKNDSDVMKKIHHLHTWACENAPEEKMIYEKGYWRQIMFIRDRAVELFYDDLVKLQAVSTHTSKSIKLPVYHLVINGVEIILRDNFHDWKVSIKSKFDLEFPKSLFFKDGVKKISKLYCEGFEEEWVLDSYAENKNEFTVEIYDDYLLYTFFYLLKEQIK